MYKTGEIIFKEGENLDKAYIILKGKVKLTSTLGYSVTSGESSIIAEWSILKDKISPESAIADSDVELADIKDIEFTYELLERSFDRLTYVNKGFSSELKPVDKVREIIKTVTKGSWRFFNDFKKSKYFLARKQIERGEFDEAYKNLSQIPKRLFSEEMDNEIEILKTLCLYFVNPKAIMERFNILRRHVDKYQKHISFTLLLEILTKGVENIDGMLNMYLKHGIYIPPKTVMMIEGEYGNDVFFILSGYVRVWRFSSKNPVLITFLGPAEIVGEVSTIGDLPRTATIMAPRPVQALLFSKDSIRKSLEANKKFALEILKASLKRIQNMKKLKETGSKIEGRIKFLKSKWGISELNRMSINIEELASFLHADKRTVVEYLIENKIASIGSDGTIKFKE
ncbi:MAG: cyclic nucleotide-binding domain-containing protein [Thermotogaceae bacterium]|nr:cyclic nucleotide-binding domain-containing protein [Thermotogaceae bacterium]